VTRTNDLWSSFGLYLNSIHFSFCYVLYLVKAKIVKNVKNIYYKFITLILFQFILFLGTYFGWNGLEISLGIGNWLVPSWISWGRSLILIRLFLRIFEFILIPFYLSFLSVYKVSPNYSYKYC
jgi:hypothetical protein